MKSVKSEMLVVRRRVYGRIGRKKPEYYKHRLVGRKLENGTGNICTFVQQCVNIEIWKVWHRYNRWSV